eukprot:NODE_25665_length_579_cov_1.221239.p3 GENE.NODE_25665_length_579_cov_1.221239~~NODE_25665_length_579_cov_1.221239.p3  ORF type:complete len:92 (+),score=13.50 NODE_25665_length_579_cov_1.221239:183-458(+)
MADALLCHAATASPKKTAAISTKEAMAAMTHCMTMHKAKRRQRLARPLFPTDFAVGRHMKAADRSTFEGAGQRLAGLPITADAASLSLRLS